MSALAPVCEKRCSRQRRSSKNQADLVVPAAKCRTEQSLMVTHCRRNYGTKLRLVSLKPRLVAAFCCILAFSAVSMAAGDASAVSMAEGEPPRPGFHRCQTNVISKNEAGIGFWKALGKTLIGYSDEKSFDIMSVLKTVFLVLVFILSVIAMSGVTGGANGWDVNIFDDKGASLNVRLAIVIPGLLLSLGGLGVASFRVMKRWKVSESKYQEWKRGDEYYADGRSFLGKRRDYHLLTAWFFVLIILAIIFFSVGPELELLEAQGTTLATAITLVSVGIFGLAHMCYNLPKVLEEDAIANGTAKKPETNDSDSDGSSYASRNSYTKTSTHVDSAALRWKQGRKQGTGSNEARRRLGAMFKNL